MNRAILHDPDIYQEPERFNPERFLKPTGVRGLSYELNTDIRDPTEVAFGFGRRVCPGRHMAYDSLWLSMASLLAVFNIRKAKDSAGNDITPEAEYHYGFTWYALLQND